MIQKTIVMLLSVVCGRIQERTRNFGHLAHETWPWTCVRSVFKFYKKQTKSENHETCQDVKISYVEAVIKNWGDFAQVCHVRCLPPRRSLHEIMKLLRRFFGLQVSYVTTCMKSSKIFIIASTYDIMTSWQVSWFLDFVCFFIEFKNNSTASS